ncbi:MAG TPA: glycosyl hydrolase family 18 protein [Symbiobacteriaceae bacterium]|nr:glycosyl hydrolase family 18 protein [Symbiobacteriaceae bacterium]
MTTPQRISQPERPRRRPSRWVAGLLLAASVALAAFQAGQRFAPVNLWDPLWVRAYLDRPIDTGAPGNGFWLSGYMVDYDRSSLEVVKTRSNHMDQVVVFGYGFDRAGKIVGNDYEIMRGVIGKSKRILLFGNLTNGNFDKETSHAILTDRAVQDQAVKGMLERVAAMDAAGVQIDFENLAQGDRDAYTAFLKRLKDELAPKGLTLSVAAAAKTSDTRTGWGGATDYAAIGQIVDQFYIMAYDEHWSGGEPGPVASLPWVEKVVRYAISVMPSQKIILGVPFYGYDWGVDPNADKSKNKAVGSARMASKMSELGATVKWDPVSGENVASYKTPDGGERVAWWPDQRSVEAKMKLAYQYNLRGVAPWRLGFEADDWWDAMGAFRVQPSK